MFDKVRNKARQTAATAAVGAMLKAETGDELNDMKKEAANQGVNGLLADNRAQGASSAVNLVVALVVGGLMAAFLLPIAIDEIVAVDTTGWTSGAAALWDILPVMIVLAIFLFFTYVAVQRSNRV